MDFLDKVGCCIGIFVIGFVLCLAGAYLDSDTADTAPAEHITHGANDFKIPAPFSEDNYQFKENNNGEDFTVMDSINGSMLTIEHLNSSEFKDLKNSPQFTERYNGVDELNYYSHKVSEVSDVPNVYKFVDVNGHEVMEDTINIDYVEVVKENGTYYKISVVNNYINNPESKLNELKNYLIKFNKMNNLTPIKII